jgi:hypothetical protein
MAPRQTRPAEAGRYDCDGSARRRRGPRRRGATTTPPDKSSARFDTTDRHESVLALDSALEAGRPAARADFLLCDNDAAQR